MVLTAPAMIEGTAGGTLLNREADAPNATANVIKSYIDHLKIWPVKAYVDRNAMLNSFSSRPEKAATEVRAVVGLKTAVEAKENSSVKSVYTVAAGLESKSVAMAAKVVELKRVIRRSDILYAAIGLEKEGLSREAFEYAWRGFHNLVKRGSLRKKAVLSIADFSQSSAEKRMYVIDIRHKRLLYRTYVAHGQNSGAEYADSFSNEPESFKSSLGFYITRTTYIGRNGLSLRLDGVDNGFNDKAMKRNIVLHGCSYVGDRYLESFGATGTSLGCPALPAAVSLPIIQRVKNGSCLFIYHPTEDYLDHSTVINE
jgi:hypothetical protein